nr:cation transporter [bacterium]
MRKQEKTVIAVAGIDIVSIVSKFFLASITGSLALLADAWHSMTDLVTSLMVLTALLLDRRETPFRPPPTTDHPPPTTEAALEDTKPGVSPYPRIIRRSCWEPRVCAFIGIALIAVAAGVFKKVYTGTGIESIRHPVIASLVVLFLILLSYIRFKFEDTVGRQTDSPALIADAYHSRADIYVLILVLVSFAGELIQIRIDRWVAGFIALLILTLGIKTIFRSLTMMFNLSRRTEPGDRTVEDSVILLTMGGFTSGKNRVEQWFLHHLRLEDPAVRTRFLRNTIRSTAALIILAWIATGLYVVGPSEQAVIEHFGRAVNLVAPAGPGLHLDWPWPVSTVRRVDTRTVHRMRLGYQIKDRGDLILWTNAHYIREYSVL